MAEALPCVFKRRPGRGKMPSSSGSTPTRRYSSWPDDLEKWEEPDVTVQIEYRGAGERQLSIYAEKQWEEKMQEALACEF